MGRDTYGRNRRNYNITVECSRIFLLARDCRNKKKEMEVLLQRLDDALNGEVEASAYDESLDSAITERLDKPLRSSSMGKERAYQDRDRINP